MFMKTNLVNLSLCIFLPFFLSAQVIFTEVMYNVVGSDYHDEYIEIFNSSTSDIFDLNNWQFSDSSGTDYIIDAGFGTLLQPGQFGVILDGSYFANSSRYDDQIPDSALILKIDNNSFGSSGLSNSYPERLYLINSSGDTVQTYQYFPDNPDGFSDEKIDFNSGNDAQNWAQSLVLGGTPGYRNSVTPYDFDLRLSQESIQFHPSIMIKSDQVVYFDLFLYNTGQQVFSDTVLVQFFSDVNHDSVLQETEIAIVKEKYEINLEPTESYTIETVWQPGQAGMYTLVLRIDSAGDQNRLNNLAAITLIVYEAEETVAINEIKFLTLEDEPEWLELFNYGAKPLNLYGWGIADRSDTSWIDSLIFLQPNQYKVFAEDSLGHIFPGLSDSLVIVLPDFPRLNNDADIIYLLNPGQGWVEQAPYEDDWLEGEDWKYPSLERIHPKLDSRKAANWGPCTAEALATPGTQNAIFTPLNRKVACKISCSPSPFSPDGDGYEDYTIIQLQSPANSGRMRVKIFDINGHLLRTIRDNAYIGPEISLVWDGRANNGKVCRMGIYIILAEILDDRNGLLVAAKTTVVLAAKM